MFKQILPKKAGGFTIIELMVASTVFSVVVLGVAYGIMGISKQYQRSMNISRTQAAARELLDNFSESMRYNSGGGPSGVAGSNTQYRCMSNKQFIFTPGRKKISGSPGNTETKNAVLIVNRPAGSCPVPADVYNTGKPAGAEELLGSNMRLAYFNVSNLAASLYTISIKVAYGDDDLLCSNTAVAGSCDSGAAAMPADKSNFFQADLRCKAGAGSEYCAVSGLTATVNVRL